MTAIMILLMFIIVSSPYNTVLIKEERTTAQHRVDTRLLWFAYSCEATPVSESLSDELLRFWVTWPIRLCQCLTGVKWAILSSYRWREDSCGKFLSEVLWFTPFVCGIDDQGCITDRMCGIHGYEHKHRYLYIDMSTGAAVWLFISTCLYLWFDTSEWQWRRRRSTWYYLYYSTKWPLQITPKTSTKITIFQWLYFGLFLDMYNTKNEE